MSKIDIEKLKKNKEKIEASPVSSVPAPKPNPPKEIKTGFGDQGAYKLISKIIKPDETIITKAYSLIGAGCIIHITTISKGSTTIATHFAEGVVILESHDVEGRISKRELKLKGR